ncbi:hypothetical protein BJY16_001774 [Actinoplanes octamycinicus]|uniref:Uncharacterized protein n=1 Tax=Actinoplanes octamycinicus TaxID=135948 RepID=A0A7W7M634_9ACTN|nr:hypothetical protein [Actinoplanes octamycinicus]MBB4738315.1 hypothetical protein [Actinoplanes octamycinicus]GIE57432.1 hypothetical protein Aoc01nite_28340 [Actinoplanes octamycinicus]
MTDAQLIDRLIEQAAQAPDWRSSCARPGHLPLFNYWGPVMYLTSAGDVIRDDEEGGQLRLADPDERNFGLARAADLYPELAHLRPRRPQAAVTCDLCRGQGRVVVSRGKTSPWPDGYELRSFLYCSGCNSLGWTLTD